MRTLLTLTLICAMFAFTGCDEGKQMAGNIISEPATPDTTMLTVAEPVATETPTEEPAPAVEPEYLSLTLDNALSLQPGTYKFRPSGYSESSETIGTLDWGSVDAWGDPIIGYPADAPKISVAIELKPEPYSLQLDGTRTVGFARLDTGEFIVDELIVEIGKELRRGTEQGGPRGNRYDWTWIVYEGTALENASNLDRLFEYE